jgi:putative membrane protein
MKISLAAASLVAALVAAPAWAQQARVGSQQAPVGSNGLSIQDERFLEQAGQGNQAEVQMGQLASQQAQNETVKEFGRWMASAHGLASREMATITERMHGMSPPSSLDPESQSMLQKLQGLHGAQFDQAYLQGMVEDHQKDLKAFHQEAQDGQDPLVKTFAQNMAPAIQEHLKEAQDLQHDLFNAAPSGSGAAADAVVHGAAGATSPTGTSK